MDGKNEQGWVTDSYGDKLHYVNDVVHNDNGPAIIFTDGSKIWYKHGKRHREDGPAAEYADGHFAWYYNGRFITSNSHEEFLNRIKFIAFW